MVWVWCLSFLYMSVIPDAQTKMSVSEISSNGKHIQQTDRQQTHLDSFHPCCPLHKIGASCKRVTMAGLCWSVFLMKVHNNVYWDNLNFSVTVYRPSQTVTSKSKVVYIIDFKYKLAMATQLCLKKIILYFFQ